MDEMMSEQTDAYQREINESLSLKQIAKGKGVSG